MAQMPADGATLGRKAIRTCIYCGEVKDVSKFTLEHVIPQSLGGAYAPDIFKTNDVCESCNSNLGLFVDAAFEKDWIVQTWVQMSAMAFFDPRSPHSLPIICMGISSLLPPGMGDDEVCESWIGPLGEQVYWIRPKEEKLYWYAGGNPRTTKDSKSRAYFFFSERSIKTPEVTWQAFRDAFQGRKKVKKILCTQITGADPKTIGFSDPDDVDAACITFFKSLKSITDGEMHNRLSFNVNFDQRFMAKLGVGVGYCLFGKKVLETEYGKELRKGIWYRESEDDEEGVDNFPKINGASAWAMKEDAKYSDIVGEEHAVSLLIVPVGDGVAVNINIGKRMSGVIKCASLDNLAQDELEKIQGGRVILLYKYLQTGISLSLPEYIAHKFGRWQHPQLVEINNRINENKNYFRDL